MQKKGLKGPEKLVHEAWFCADYRISSGTDVHSAYSLTVATDSALCGSLFHFVDTAWCQHIRTEIRVLRFPIQSGSMPQLMPKRVLIALEDTVWALEKWESKEVMLLCYLVLISMIELGWNFAPAAGDLAPCRYGTGIGSLSA